MIIKSFTYLILKYNYKYFYQYYFHDEFKCNKKINFQDYKENTEKEIKEATLLNLYFIIKKKINEFFNKHIHNEPVKLNKIAKESIAKYENEKFEKDLKIKEEKNKSQNPNINIKENEIKGQKDILIQKNVAQENSSINKCCDKISPAYIKKNIKIKDDQSKNELEGINFEVEPFDIKSSILLFNQHLKDKEATMFNIKSNLNLDDAINLYLKGEKSQNLFPDNNELNELKNNELEEKLENIIEASKTSKSVTEIKNYIEEIKGIIDNNLKNIKYSEINSINFLSEYEKYFDVNFVIKQLDISTPLDIFDLITKIREKIKKSMDFELYEKCLYMTQVYKFLYYEEFKRFYGKIKEKIQKSNIDNIFSLNEAKNILIKEAKTRFQEVEKNDELIGNIWEDLNKEKKLVENKDVNANIKDYINKWNFEKFVNDFSDTFGNDIKDINIYKAAPQNSFLKLFMIQHDLYYEID